MERGSGVPLPTVRRLQLWQSWDPTTRQHTAAWALSGPRRLFKASGRCSYPPVVADSENKTLRTAESSGRLGLGRVTAGPTGVRSSGLAAKQTAIV